jgi:hypothetical protein
MNLTKLLDSTGRPASCCRSCGFVVDRADPLPQDKSHRSYFCAFNPPATYPVFKTDPLTLDITGCVGWVSSFPSVTPEDKCGKYQMRVN